MNVVIIGGGIIGCAVARFLSEYQLNITVLERGADVSVGATKANSGILHSGYDCKPGTVKADMNVKGLAMYPRLAQELDIPYRMNGSMVISMDATTDKLQALYENGIANGVTGMEILTGQEAKKIEPNLNHLVTSALRAKNAGIISPYEAAIAFAENAAENGAKFILDTTVTGIKPSNDGFIVHTTSGDFSASVVINAAGVESGNIYNMVDVHSKKESILPQRGQYYLLDNTQRELVSHTIFQLPTRLGKGVLIAPTVDYNVLIGPTAEDIDDLSDTSTTVEGLAETLEKAKYSLESVPVKDRITNFAGIRAKHESQDFIINESIPGFINALGIDSPGLTSAPAIASRIAEMALARLEPKKNASFNPRRLGIKRFRELNKQEQSDLIRQNPAYGRIVCRCETITEAEILEAIRRPIGARNLDAIKRRTRAQMGRCQGGFCSVRLIELLSQELNIDETAVTKNGAGSEVVLR